MDKESNAKQNGRRGLVSYSFKITVVILFFIFTFLRLMQIQYFTYAEIVSDRVFLFIALSMMLYLWIQDRKDYHYLVRINKDLGESQERLKQAEVDVIASLVKIEEIKDQYTKGHSERVTKLALAIAQEMNLSQDSIRIIARAGVLHDIGKIGIRDDILHKVGKLTDEEWEIIKNHSEIGYNVLAPFKFLDGERQAILSHHERLDGKGYPKALKADEICLEAKILAVADAFDAMNSKRPYRDPLSHDTILQELIKGKDKQHSAQIVDAFLTLLKKNPSFWNL